MLISEEHLSDQVKRHITDPEYGGESIEYAPQISAVINQLGVEQVLDYGAGKGELPKHLVLDHRVQVTLYDPAVHAIAEAPEPNEMTVCVNVLEHVEKECLEDVLDDLVRCTQRVTFIVISGEIEDWIPKLMPRFRIESLVRSDMDFFMIASAKHGN